MHHTNTQAIVYDLQLDLPLLYVYAPSAVYRFLLVYTKNQNVCVPWIKRISLQQCYQLKRFSFFFRYTLV